MPKTTPNQPDVLDRIRSACRQVAERARFVRVQTDQIACLAAKLPEPIDRIPTYDLEHHFRGDDVETLTYIVTLDAVNFGSGWFPHLAKRPGLSGYFTIATSLANLFHAAGPLDAASLADITPSTCAKIFQQDLMNKPIAQLMTLFARAWNDLGRDLLSRFDGRFCQLIEAAGRSASQLIEIVSAQPLFRDVAIYAGFEVPLYKRAQILASDLALAFEGEGYGCFDDLDRLTLFADNLVPHVLRMEGLLEYSPDLLKRVERGDLLPAGSPEEVEIRACSVHAVALLTQHLRCRGVHLSDRHLDVYLWSQGQRPAVKAHPRHRTRTVFY